MILESLEGTSITIHDLNEAVERKTQRLPFEKSLPEKFWENIMLGLPLTYSDDLFSEDRSKAVYLSQYTENPINPSHSYCISAFEQYQNKYNYSITAGTAIDFAFNAKLLDPSSNLMQNEDVNGVRKNIASYISGDVTRGFGLAAKAKILLQDNEVTNIIKPEHINSYKSWFDTHREESTMVSIVAALESAANFKILFPHEKQLLTGNDQLPQQILEQFRVVPKPIAVIHFLFPIAIISANRIAISDRGLELNFSELPSVQLPIPQERKF